MSEPLPEPVTIPDRGLPPEYEDEPLFDEET